MIIRLMTFHTPKNYGAVLQAYALQTYLKKKCDNVKFIDYNTETLRGYYPLVQKPKSIKGVAVTGLSLLYLPAKIKKYKKFDNFVSNNLDLTEQYESTETLYKNPPKCDLMITGSDQVFNPNRILPERQAFYLDFANKHTTIASYAASFGVSSISKETQAEIAKYLKRFHYLSVRETDGIEIIRQLTGQEAIEVVDPTFLLNKEEWQAIGVLHRNLPSKYFLYYKILSTLNGDRVVEELSQKLGYDLVVITDKVPSKVKAKYVIRDVGPSQFIHLYANASFVATDAFHGTAFSIIFKKQFVFCDENQNTKQRSANLLRQLNLQDRMLPNDVDTIVSTKIDYDAVDSILKGKVELSKKYLNALLNNCN